MFTLFVRSCDISVNFLFAIATPLSMPLAEEFQSVRAYFFERRAQVQHLPIGVGVYTKGAPTIVIAGVIFPRPILGSRRPQVEV